MDKVKYCYLERTRFLTGSFLYVKGYRHIKYILKNIRRWSMIKNLFHVGQKVECRLDEKFYSGTVTEVYDDYIIVDVPEVSDHCWFEENFNIGCVYP